MDILSGDKVAKIRELNDNFRTNFRGGQILLTQAVAGLPSMVAAAALQKVAEFTNFNEENDSCEEHDYLSFDLCNREFVFIIQYWNLEIDGPSIDPADPSVTKRIAILMLIHEW